jgi:hypothetical protein
MDTNTTPAAPALVRYPTDGHTRPLTVEDITVGLVTRYVMSDGAVDHFSDSVITSVEKNEHGLLCKIARPYLRVTPDGTPVVSFESYEAYAHRLIERHVVVMYSTGKPVINLATES